MARGSAPFRDGEARPGPFCVFACVVAVAATGPSSGDDGFLLRLWPFVVAMRSPLAPPADRARGRVADSMLVPWGGTRYQAAAPPRSFAELYRTARAALGAARTPQHGQHDSCRPPGWR